MKTSSAPRPDYTLVELAALTGLSPRTIRYYVTQGLVPSPGREGPATRYPEATLARLRVIARLRDAHRPLAAIRRDLAGLTDDSLIELASREAEVPPPAQSALDYVRRVLNESARFGGAGGAQPPLLAMASMLPAEPDRDVRNSRTALGSTRVLGARGADRADARSQTSPSGERSQWERIALGPDIELHVRRPLSRRDDRLVERIVAFARQLQGEEK